MPWDGHPQTHRTGSPVTICSLGLGTDERTEYFECSESQIARDSGLVEGTGLEADSGIENGDIEGKHAQGRSARIVCRDRDGRWIVRLWVRASE